ncbi:hypothetical protein BZL42_09690 [Pseudomonas indica]|nr:hypothetical protein BZL42_09690 [Pseudomonas indica]
MPNDSLTVYLGGAGMAGSYIDDQVNNLMRAGIKNSVAGRLSEGMFVDAIDGVGRFRERVKTIKGLGEYGPYAKEATWSLDTIGVYRPLPVYGQFNLIGYSWGSLVAAQMALYYADQGQKVDHLVLVGSPISAEMLAEVRKHPRIKNVIVINLDTQGDKIYAGMPYLELLSTVPDLVTQMGSSQINESGAGHFYYGSSGFEGSLRRQALARSLYAQGLR